MDDLSDEPQSQSIDDRSSLITMSVMVLLVGMILAGGFAYTMLKPKASPPPSAIANDPLLAAGRALYLERCASCHGENGVGDGPVAAISDVPPGNLADGEWKYGDRPQDVLRVISEGVQGAMPGWDKTFREPERAAVAAYVYHLAGRDVPEALRGDFAETDREPSREPGP